MFVSHHEFMYGKAPGQSSKKVISVDSTQDFPSLSAGLGVPTPAKPQQSSAWGQSLFESKDVKVQKAKGKKQAVVEEPFPTLPEAKPQPVVVKKAPEPVKVVEKPKSIFEEGKFEALPLKEDNEAIVVGGKKGGKKGKGKAVAVAVDMKGGFW